MLHYQLLKSSITNEELVQSNYVIAVAKFEYVMHIDHVAHVVVIESNL